MVQIMNFSSPLKQDRDIDDWYRVFGFNLYNKYDSDEIDKSLRQKRGQIQTNSDGQQDFRIATKSLKGQNNSTHTDENFPMKDVNLVLTVFQNLDVAEMLYFDYTKHFVYVNVYYWKWYFIYMTAFLTLSVVVFTLTLININVVRPIKEITEIIEYTQNTNREDIIEEENTKEVKKRKLSLSRRRIHSKKSMLNTYCFGNDKSYKVDEVDQLRRLFIQFFIQSSPIKKKFGHS